MVLSNSRVTVHTPSPSSSVIGIFPQLENCPKRLTPSALTVSTSFISTEKVVIVGSAGGAQLVSVVHSAKQVFISVVPASRYLSLKLSGFAQSCPAMFSLHEKSGQLPLVKV